MDKHIDKATIHFQKLLQDQLARVDRMSAREEQTDFESLDPIIIGIIGGDGIGPFIAAEAQACAGKSATGSTGCRKNYLSGY